MATFNLGGLGARSEKAGTMMIAYGSNLNPVLMGERVGPYRIYSIGTVPGYRLTFAGQSRRWGGPVATLVKTTRETAKSTPVVVYVLDDDQMETMDANEGVGIGVYRKEQIYVTTPFEKFRATVYLHNSTEYGKPTREYVNAIRRGYKSFGFDESILDAAIRAAK